jgi:hypothetical protein
VDKDIQTAVTFTSYVENQGKTKYVSIATLLSKKETEFEGTHIYYAQAGSMCMSVQIWQFNLHWLIYIQLIFFNNWKTNKMGCIYSVHVLRKADIHTYIHTYIHTCMHARTHARMHAYEYL